MHVTCELLQKSTPSPRGKGDTIASLYYFTCPSHFHYLAPPPNLQSLSQSLSLYYYIYRHMEEFWGASKAFFTEKWAYLYRNYGHENFFIMYIVGKLFLFSFSVLLSRVGQKILNVTTIIILIIENLYLDFLGSNKS